MSNLNFQSEPTPALTDKLVGFKDQNPQGERTYTLQTLKTFFNSTNPIVRVTVANQAARYALTIATVQAGDFVFQTDTSTLYEVTDETKLAPFATPAQAFTALATVAWGQITGKPTTLSGYGITDAASSSDLTAETARATAAELANASAIAVNANSRAPKQGLVFDGTAGASASRQAIGTGGGGFAVALYINDVSAISPSSFNEIVSGTNGMSLYANNTGRLGFAKSSSLDYGLFPTAGVRFGVWDLYELTRSDTTVNLYRNGALLDTLTIPADVDFSATTLVLGAGGTVSTAPWPCVIQLLGYYNYARSADQVAKLFATGAVDPVDMGGSMTALNVSTFTNSGYTTFSGASSTGFTAAKSGVGPEGNVLSSPVFNIRTGQRFLVRFTLTLTSGSAPNCLISNGAGGYVGSENTATSAGSNSLILTANRNDSAALIRFYNGALVASSYSVSGLSVIPLGALLAPDPQQLGAGPQWRDVSGNASHITLPADGVTGGVVWALPTQRSVDLSIDISGASGNSFVLASDIQRIPAGWSITAARVYTPTGQGASNVKLGKSSGGAEIVASNAVSAANYVPLTLVNPQPVFVTGTRLYLNRSATLNSGSKLLLTITQTA